MVYGSQGQGLIRSATPSTSFPNRRASGRPVPDMAKALATRRRRGHRGRPAGRDGHLLIFLLAPWLLGLALLVSGFCFGTSRGWDAPLPRRSFGLDALDAVLFGLVVCALAGLMTVLSLRRR